MQPKITTHEVSIHEVSYADMLEAVKCRVSENIANCFPEDLVVVDPEARKFRRLTRSPRQLKLSVARYQVEDVSSGRVRHDFAQRGLRPAIFEELCALGAEHSDLQLGFPIAALNSRWRRSDGATFIRYHVAVLSEMGGQRILEWNYDDDWCGQTAFLGAPIDSEKARF